MKKLRLKIRQYFDFSEKEVNGFIVLIFLMFILLFAPAGLQLILPNAQAGGAKDEFILDSMEALMSENVEEKIYSKNINLVKFDPNTASKAILIKVGCKEYLAERIVKFRSKGGKFYKKTDLKKIYGFPDYLYQDVEPYIALPDSGSKIKGNNYQKTYKRAAPKANIQFDINTADSNQLEKIFMVGFKTANRIIKYRDRLGGFVAMEQLYEVWKLDSSVVDELKVKSRILPNFEPLKININTADFAMMKDHPYIGYKLAKVIISFRQQHGKYHGPEQLAEIKLLSIEDIKKMTPYISFDE